MKINQIPILSILIFILTIQSCKDKDKVPEPEIEFNESGMLTNLSDNLITPSYQTLNDDVNLMKTAISNFTNTVNSTNLTAARDAWKSAVLTWQKVSVFQIGPASDIALRENINLFPVDTTLINNNIKSGSYDLATATNFTAKGFQAIDYLLYGIGSTDQEIINMYTSNTYTSNRITYLLDVTNDISTKVASVNTEWSTYSASFKSNTGTDIGSSIGLLTNELNLYYERYLRDGKIGIPSGASTFSQTPLPNKSECFYYNQNSVALFNEGLSIVKKLYLGEGLDGIDGLGYDDYLNFKNAQSTNGSLNDVIKNQFTVIETRALGLGNSVATEVSTNQQEMLGLFDDMQFLNNLLKVEMTNSLEVQINYSDTDGD